MAANGNRDQLAKAALILELLATTTEPWRGVREIAKSLNLSTTTAHRTLTALLDIGYVRQEPATGRYAIGTELLRISSSVRTSDPFLATARPHLHALSEQTHESALLAKLDVVTRSLVFVEVVNGSRELDYDIPLYRHLSLRKGASGLSILAHLSAGQEQFESVALPPTLGKIRASGIALTRGQRIPGALGISAPVVGSGGAVLGSVTLTLPESRAPSDPQCARFATLVRGCAQRIRHDLVGSSATVPANRAPASMTRTPPTPPRQADERPRLA